MYFSRKKSGFRIQQTKIRNKSGLGIPVNFNPVAPLTDTESIAAKVPTQPLYDQHEKNLP